MRDARTPRGPARALVLGLGVALSLAAAPAPAQQAAGTPTLRFTFDTAARGDAGLRAERARWAAEIRRALDRRMTDAGAWGWREARADEEPEYLVDVALLPLRAAGAPGVAYSVAVSRRGTFSGWKFLERNVAHATDAGAAAEGIVRYATATALARR